jgi:hypothetical protein
VDDEAGPLGLVLVDVVAPAGLGGLTDVAAAPDASAGPEPFAFVLMLTVVVGAPAGTLLTEGATVPDEAAGTAVEGEGVADDTGGAARSAADTGPAISSPSLPQSDVAGCVTTARQSCAAGEVDVAST